MARATTSAERSPVQVFAASPMRRAQADFRGTAGAISCRARSRRRGCATRPARATERRGESELGVTARRGLEAEDVVAGGIRHLPAHQRRKRRRIPPQTDAAGMWRVDARVDDRRRACPLSSGVDRLDADLLLAALAAAARSRRRSPLPSTRVAGHADQRAGRDHRPAEVDMIQSGERAGRVAAVRDAVGNRRPASCP